MAKRASARAEKQTALFVPGGVTPADLAYGGVIRALDGQVNALTKDLDVYAGDRPPTDFGLGTEVEGILRTVEEAGIERFHLVGFSAGGAVSLAFAAKYPQRLRSLALVEPAWIGNDGWTAEDTVDFAELDRVMALPPAERMPAFQRWQLRPGVEPPPMPPPFGPPPAWMAKRPAGLDAFDRAFKTYTLDRTRLREFHRAVYYAYGSLSRPFYERNAATLAKLFTDFRVEVYEGRWHFDPPHRSEPERFAKALLAFWEQTPD